MNEKKVTVNIPEVGDVCQLKSGGPKMTIFELNSDNVARCVWFNKNDICQADYFPLSILWSGVTDK